MAFDFLKQHDTKLEEAFNAKPAKDATPARREKVMARIDEALAQLKAGETSPRGGLYKTKDGVEGVEVCIKLGSRPLVLDGRDHWNVPDAAKFFTAVKGSAAKGELDAAIRALFTDEKGGKTATKGEGKRAGNYGWSEERKAKFQQTLAAKKAAKAK